MPPPKYEAEPTVAEAAGQAAVARQDQNEDQDNRQQDAVEHLDTNQQLDDRDAGEECHDRPRDQEKREQTKEDWSPPEIEVDALAEPERLADRVGRGQRQDAA